MIRDDPQLDEIKIQINDIKQNTKKMDIELRQLQAKKQSQYEEMETLSNQVTALKSKRILILNGLDPYSKINEINQDSIKEENFKFNRIK